VRRVVVAGLAGALALSGPSATASVVAEPNPPDLVKLLDGYTDLWTPDPAEPLHGAVDDPEVLQRNDELAVWINRHATPAQQFAALQDAPYGSSPDSYDQSITISTGLGSQLGPIYVQGRRSGALPLTGALVNSTGGSAGAFVGTGTAKDTFGYPRPFLPTDPAAPATAGDDVACAPESANASALRALRVDRSYADADGNLTITRVPAAVDATRAFATDDVALDAGYGSPAVCATGSFPSGHTATAFQAGVALATLIPELGPEILARASENGNNRVVLGVHYPLDVIGGRMGGEAAVAALWSDEQFRTQVLEPARQELVGYLQDRCGDVLAACIAKQTPYQADPYAGASMPGGTAQIVRDRASAVAVAGERLSYGFARTGPSGLDPSVPDGADELLRTTFPTLTDAQRRSVLAQTQLGSGYPLDRSDSGDGSWQRVNLAAAMSATVELDPTGTVTVTSVGGPAVVVPAPGPADPTSSVVPSTAAIGPTPSGADTPSAFGSAGGPSGSPVVAWSIAGALVLAVAGAGLVLGVRHRSRRRAG
jgi:hypothetical protein